MNELSRIITADGTVVKNMADGSVEVSAITVKNAVFIRLISHLCDSRLFKSLNQVLVSICVCDSRSFSQFTSCVGVHLCQ